MRLRTPDPCTSERNVGSVQRAALRPTRRTSGKRWTNGTLTGVASRWLLDTGFLVALARPEDPAHRTVADFWKGFRGSLVTVEGILVESAWLLRRIPKGFETALRILVGTNALVATYTEDRYVRSAELMRKYHDIPMDLVDALLVCVAEETRISQILTLDRRGFEAYRIHGRKRFTILP